MWLHFIFARFSYFDSILCFLFSNFIHFFVFHFPGTAAEHLESARVVHTGLWSTGWEPLDNTAQRVQISDIQKRGERW